MKIFEYILKFGFMLAVSLSLPLVMAPALWQAASDRPDKLTNGVQMEYFSLSFIDTDDINYLILEIRSNDDNTYIRNFYVPDNKHEKVIAFLVEKELLIEGTLPEQIPFEMSKEAFSRVGNNAIITEGERGIEQLVINDQYLLGGKSYFKIGMLYFLSGVFAILGIAGLLLTILAFSYQYKAFKETGTFPDLPNSINSKAEGIKFLIRGFKHKK